jgi:hypothetical protein
MEDREKKKHKHVFLGRSSSKVSRIFGNGVHRILLKILHDSEGPLCFLAYIVLLASSAQPPLHAPRVCMS